MSNDGTIAGWETGSGPALLFLHGGPGMNDYGRLLSDEVAAWRFISFQQRGITPSTTVGPFTVEQHVADAIAVLDERGVDKAIVLGHSWGAHLALHLAVMQPHRVAGLVIVDGLGVIGDGGAAELAAALKARLEPATAQKMRDILEEQGDSAPTDDFVARQFSFLWASYFADPANAPAPPELRFSAVTNVATMASVREHLADGFAASLRSVSVPVISVLGAQSPMPVSQGEETAVIIPNAEVRVIPKAGHLPWHEKPGCVAAALADVTRRAGLGG
jgi:pimeloyl-ACP methyl ester carboxylesterase